MKINELKITALGKDPELTGTPITPDSTHPVEPKMDLEFKTDIVAPEHTNANPDYTQELAPEGVPQNVYNDWRDKQFAPKPESEWSNVPNKYAQKLIDLRQQGIDAFKKGTTWLKDKLTRDRNKDPNLPEQPEWTGESMKNLNRMRTLAGLNESGDLPGEDVWAYSPKGKGGGAAARVVRTEHGFQVYVMGPYGWIAQGQPHMSQEEAQDDALSFFEAVSMIDFDKLNEEELKEIRSVLELNEEQLTEEETSGHEVVSVLPESKLTEGWGSIAKWLGLGGIIASGGKAIQDFTTGAKEKVKKGTSRTQQALDNAGVGNKKTVTNSADPQPWWRDMTTTLQEMKAEMMENPKKK